jgi:hypothetical protein
VNPKGAEGGADILTRNAVAIVVAIRSGRRATDQFAVVVPDEVKSGDAVVVEKPTDVPSPLPSKDDDETASG